MNKKLKKHLILYGLFSIICIVINTVYAQFSHGVSSNYMTYMFIYPLTIGVVSSVLNYKNFNGVTDLFLCGILTLTIGSFLQGIFEIAGTSSYYSIVFYIIGVIVILVGLIYLAIKMIKD